MKSTDMHKSWQSQPTNEDLIVRLFNEAQHHKVRTKLNGVRLGTLLFTAYNLIVFVLASMSAFDNLESVSPLIGNVVLSLLSGVVFYKNILQLSAFGNLDTSLPIIHFRRRLEFMKIERVRHNRFIFLTCILYFWSFLITIFQWDIITTATYLWEKTPITVFVHLAFVVGWIPLAIWLLKKYDSSTASGFWGKLGKNSMLTDDLINVSFNEAIIHLEEIQEFETDSTDDASGAIYTDN